MRQANLLKLKVVGCVRCYDLGLRYSVDGSDPAYCKCEVGQRMKERAEVKAKRARWGKRVFWMAKEIAQRITLFLYT